MTAASRRKNSCSLGTTEEDQSKKPSYPPRDEPVRKRQILQKRERELRHALAHGFAPDRIERAAKQVRFAKLKLIKAIVGELPFQGQSEEVMKRWAKAKTEEELWISLTVDEIIKRYEEVGLTKQG